MRTDPRRGRLHRGDRVPLTVLPLHAVGRGALARRRRVLPALCRQERWSAGVACAVVDEEAPGTSAAMREARENEVVTVLRFEDHNINFYKRRCVWMLERLAGQQLLERALSKEETAAMKERAELRVPVCWLADAMTTFMGESAPARCAARSLGTRTRRWTHSSFLSHTSRRFGICSTRLSTITINSQMPGCFLPYTSPLCL